MNSITKLRTAIRDQRLIFETERVIQNFFRVFGINVTRYKHGNYGEDPLVKQLAAHKIDLVLDVGANIGQYASDLYNLGYNKRVVSFEPLPYAYSKLREKSKGNKNWEVAENCAVGEKDGETKINVSKNSVSSSLLEQTGTQTDVEPGAAYTRAIKIKMRKLDSIAPPYIKKGERVLLKLDVQGYEDQVLKGAMKTLPRVQGIQIETSLEPLYEGELVFEEMLKKIEGMGFELYDLVPGFRNNKTGQLLQVDCIFFRK